MVVTPKTAVARASDSEKITINLGYVDLGQIDLLVRGRLLFQPDGFYPDGDPNAARSPQRRGQAVRRATATRSGFAPIQPARSRDAAQGGRSNFISRCSGWPSSPPTSRPIWRGLRLRPSKFSARSTPALKSRRP